MNPWAFTFQGMGRLIFGSGRLAELPARAMSLGSNALLVTGGRSFAESPAFEALIKALGLRGVTTHHVSLVGEPSPQWVDDVVGEYGEQSIDLVLSIGGGSAIDGGKAVSAMLPLRQPVADYLEGVGDKQHPGRKLPFIAVPTTSGAGAEATKNAVLSRIGPDGYKKSLRHDNFVPDLVLIDPDLMLLCPRAVTAACGMDALTQLIEAYTSTGASPLTDALAWSGLQAVAAHLLPACGQGACDPAVRAAMAYGAYLSGVALTHAGLGVVHGFASPIGGFFPIPHGVVCGTLLAPGTRANIDWLQFHAADHPAVLAKYAAVGRLIADQPHLDDATARQALIATLEDWSARLDLPWLSDFGFTAADVPRVLAATALKSNPAKLDHAAQSAILIARIR